MDRSDKGERASHAMELEQTQEKLRRSEELYRYVVELSSLLPWTADAEGRILSAGGRWTSWTGTERAAALGEAWQDFIHPDDVERVTSAWRDAVDNRDRFELEWRVRTADGSYRWTHARAAKRSDKSNGELVWYGTLEDVHERRVALDAFRRAQAELARFSRLSAMGAMASAIAHDLNQPLTAITHYVRGSKRLIERVEGEGKPALAEALEDADRSALRASDIVRRVREFVARGTVDARREDLAVLVAEACRFGLADPSAEDIVCRTVVETACQVLADRIQIQQVLVNLIQNAVESMQGQQQRRLEIRIGAGRPGFCQVSLRDTGHGITAKDGTRVFDPLYSTRSGGMGVGLSICRMIIEAHGGAIWHQPAPDGGTIFSFSLPTADQKES